MPLLIVIGGGLFGALGGDMLIDMNDSDAGGEIRSGSVVVPVVAALATAAVVVDCRAHLRRIDPGRRGVWGWSAVVLAAPLAASTLLAVAAIAADGALADVLVALALLAGGMVGAVLVRRWAAPSGEL